MENINKGSNKNLFILILLVFMLLFMAYFAYSYFFEDQEFIAVKINRVTSEQLGSKVLNVFILEDPRFTGLKKINFEIPSLDSIDTGKDNPFGG
ncbi:MAG: hypothetical protein U9Q85_02340 [Patescibacteria group bacterium]|nr:hypothetical protein [Patescibacteria group bacterium]